jgi:hypothetical protein
MLLLAFLAVATSAVVNDFCSGALPATNGVNSGTNVGSLYRSQTYQVSYNDVFYKYNATTTGTAVISVTTPASSYIYVAVYYGQSCDLLSPSYDTYLSTGSGYCTATTSSFPILQNQVYYFAIGGYGYTTAFTFTITATTTARPAGDTCYNPIQIPASGLSSAQIDGAFQDDYHLYAGEPELFWAYTANCTGTATATLTTALTGALQNYYDNRCSHIIGSGIDQKQEYNEGSNTSITFPVWNGQTYIIAGGDWACSTPTGTFDIAVTCTPVASPANDICTGAQTIATGVQFTTSAVNANNNFNDNLVSCSLSGPEVWVAWNATCTGNATFLINSSDVAVLRGSCSDGVPVYCGYGSSHTFTVTQGDTLFIALNYGSQVANLVGSISCAAQNGIPANTYCANAVAVGASQQYNNVAAVSDPATYFGNDFGTCNSYNTLFFTYTFTCTGQVTINFASLTPSNYLTLALYQDSTCSAHPVAYCDEDVTQFQFNSSQGDTYTFSIGNYYSNDYLGNFWLNTSCNGPQSAPTAPTGGSTPTAPTGGSTPTAPTAKATPTAPTAKATPTAPTAKATPTAPTAPTSPTTATTTKAPSNSAGVVGFGLATVLSVLLL